ncbi:MAG: Uma2 family endonuclease [Planctomycetota bacterium]
MSTATVTRGFRRPRPGEWTYADYCKIPEDRKRHEIIDGRHYVTPSPDYGHQRASGGLFRQLMDKVDDTGKGTVFTAPFDVHIGRLSLVVPDLVVVCRRNESVITKKKITGVPDLLVEVLSPSSVKRDLQLKKRRYQRAGVREYWVVDHERKRVEQFVLVDGRYGPANVCTRRIRLHAVRGVVIDLRRVFG